MNQSAENAVELLHMLGCAMLVRKSVPRDEALAWWRRLLIALDDYGKTDLDPEVWKTTENGKLLTEAGAMRVTLGWSMPDPTLPDFVDRYMDWLKDVILTAAGKQQLYEIRNQK